MICGGKELLEGAAPSNSPLVKRLSEKIVASCMTCGSKELLERAAPSNSPLFKRLSEKIVASCMICGRKELLKGAAPSSSPFQTVSSDLGRLYYNIPSYTPQDPN